MRQHIYLTLQHYLIMSALNVKSLQEQNSLCEEVILEESNGIYEIIIRDFQTYAIDVLKTTQCSASHHILESLSRTKPSAQ